MTDLEKFTPSKQVFISDNIEMRGKHFEGGVYEVHAFKDGVFSCKMSYHGAYDKAQIDYFCAILLAHLSK